MRGLYHPSYRARGIYKVELVTRLAGELTRSGVSDARIRRNLGMNKDELLHPRQISGLVELFMDKEFRMAVE